MTIPYSLDPSDWTTIAPHYDALLAEHLTPSGVSAWLKRWSDLQQQIWEERAALKRDRARPVERDGAAGLPALWRNGVRAFPGC